MFDTIVHPSSGVPRQRWTTTAVSAAGHLEVITFVSVAPPPPPPPPPPMTEPIEPVKRAAVKATAVTRPAPVMAKVPVAAPVEAPDAITPETGLEGGEFAAASVDAGFERGFPGGIAGGIVGGFECAPPPPPPAPIAPVRVGGAVSAPRLAYRVEPEYPTLAVTAAIEGMVILEATVDETGAVKDARVLRSHGVLDAPAVRAVEQWRYEPLLLNGSPTPFVLTVTVSFSLAR